MSRRRQTHTPPTSPLRPGPSDERTAKPRVAGPRNDLERLVSAIEQKYKHPDQPGTDWALEDEAEEELLSIGYSEDQLAQYRREYDEYANEYAKRFGDQIVASVMGAKPEKTNEQFEIYNIPNTRNPKLALRLWNGGMERHGSFCLDYFDLDNKRPVNTPRGYKIVSPGGTLPNGSSALWSFESAFGIAQEDILQGEERFGVPEGSHWCLLYNGAEVLRFAVPRRINPGFILPTRF